MIDNQHLRTVSEAICLHLVGIDAPDTCQQGRSNGIGLTYHQVLRAALQLSTVPDMDSEGSPMARAVRTAIPQYM